MRSRIFLGGIAVFLLAVGGLAFLVLVGRDPEQTLGPQPGQAIADLTLTDLAGHAIRLADFRKAEGREGKVVVLSIWSPTCPTGKSHLAAYDALARWCQERGVEYYALDSYGDSAEKAAQLAKENGVTYPVCMDESTAIAKALGARTVTATYVLDRTGAVAYRGALDNGKDGAARVLYPAAAAQELLDGKPVSAPKVRPFG